MAVSSGESRGSGGRPRPAYPAHIASCTTKYRSCHPSSPDGFRSSDEEPAPRGNRTAGEDTTARQRRQSRCRTSCAGPSGRMCRDALRGSCRENILIRRSRRSGRAHRQRASAAFNGTLCLKGGAVRIAPGACGREPTPEMQRCRQAQDKGRPHRQPCNAPRRPPVFRAHHPAGKIAIRHGHYQGGMPWFAATMR